MSVADELAKLAALRASGVLSDREFELQKVHLLGRTTTSPSPRQTVGAYDLLDLVGEGGMGTVFRARHRSAPIAERQGGFVAVKLLHHHLATKPGLIERFRQEAEALSALDHPNIVKVLDVVEEGGQIALVMEWIPGRPLSHLIGRETGPIPWERARLLVWPLLDAVEHAHARGIVHRDLKPDNIRVTPDGTVKILDFGIARVGETRGRTKTGTGMGTIDYMAPEQYTDAKTVDARADIYALGMTLYEMVAGRLPWEPGDTEFTVLQRKHRGDLPPPTVFYPAIPDWVVNAIQLALTPDPNQRPAHVGELRNALTTGLTGASPPRDAAPSPQVEGASPHAASSWEPVVPASGLRRSMHPLWILSGARGRIGRTQLLWGAFLYVVWLVVVLLGFGVVVDATGPDGPVVGLVVAASWPVLALTVKRCHDLNVSGWVGAGLAILFTGLLATGPLGILLPVYGVVLLVMPGTDGPNRYGVDRRPPSAQDLSSLEN